MDYMKSPGIVLAALLPVLFFFTAQAQEDSLVHYQKDSAVIAGDDPTTMFFQNEEKSKTPAKILLVTKTGKIVSLPNFLRISDFASADYVLSDMDNDGKKELLVNRFTGGAHCCDEIHIFKNTGPNKYQYAAKMFAGHTLITKEKEFVYTFYEQFGYFFTCYACGLSDTTDTAPIDIRAITLHYSKGKLLINPGDQELRSIINDNLAKLGEQPYEKLDGELAQDNGLRKEFAMNLAVFYYSFGKNLPETQKLFNKYYKFPDAKKVWTEFVKQLLQIKKDNDF
jgi:hypothetical protein